jgi:hypothetical protein
VSTATTIYGVATRLVAAIDAALTSIGTPVVNAAVYPAMIPWDQCECGTLAVAVQRQYVTSNFPAVDETEQIPCQGGFVAADLVVQVLRCAPSPGTNRSLVPSTNALQDTAQLILSDGWVALSVVQCTLADLVDTNDIIEYVVRPQVFAGPAGGCVGSAVGASIAVEQSASLI